MQSRKIRFRRGAPPIVVYPLPDKEIFDRQWGAYMNVNSDYPVNTDWGMLNRDQAREKLTQIFEKSQDAHELSRYSAYWNHLHFVIPAEPVAPAPII